MPNRGVLVFVTTILIVTGAYVSTSELMSPSSASSGQVASSTSSATSNSTYSTGSIYTTNFQSSYQVLQRNLTVYYDTACMVVSFEEFGCPTINAAAHSPSLGNVELISYQGSEFYGINFTGSVNGQGFISTVWFTNSTIFCASPMVSGYPACPTRPQPYSIVVTESSTSVLNSSTGLRLDLQLFSNPNDTSKLGVEIDVFNTKSSVNNVTAYGWTITPTLPFAACTNFATGFLIYQGNYDARNFTSGSPLVLVVPGLGPPCPAAVPPVNYSFSPDSDNASSYGNVPPELGTAKTISISDSLEGYWTGNGSAPALNPFNPGIYTLVAVDRWGQAAILQFTVKDA